MTPARRIESMGSWEKGVVSSRYRNHTLISLPEVGYCRTPPTPERGSRHHQSWQCCEPSSPPCGEHSVCWSPKGNQTDTRLQKAPCNNGRKTEEGSWFEGPQDQGDGPQSIEDDERSCDR